MRYPIMLWIMLVPFIAFGAQSKQATKCADLQRVLKQTVQDYSLTEPGLVEALAHVASEFQFPLGVEWVRERSTLKGVHLVLKQTTVRGIIKSIISTHPGYTSDISGCFVHVYPTALISERRNFLNIRLKKFQSVGPYTGDVNWKLLRQVGEIVSPRAAEGQPARGGTLGSRVIGADETRMSFTMEAPTVREVLNRIILNSGFSQWVVTFNSDFRLTSTGFWETEWANGKPEPKNKQPTWEIVSWGTDPVGYVTRNDWRQPKPLPHLLPSP